MEGKICPLLLATLPKASSKEMSRCQKDECAWYVKLESPDVEGCAIRELSHSLKAIHLKM